MHVYPLVTISCWWLLEKKGRCRGGSVEVEVIGGAWLGSCGLH